MNIGIPRVFGVAVDRISVCLKLKIASGAFMGTPFDGLTAGIMAGTPCGKVSPGGVSFWRRSCSYQPKSQMIEDIPDHRRGLDEADDPHGPLTFRADQGIYFVG